MYKSIISRHYKVLQGLYFVVKKISKNSVLVVLVTHIQVVSRSRLVCDFQKRALLVRFQIVILYQFCNLTDSSSKPDLQGQD